MKQFCIGPMVVLLAMSIMACQPNNLQSNETQSVPKSWIDAPLDGNVFPPNPIEVISHSTDPYRIVQVELSANGAVVQSSPNADNPATLVTTKQQWSPPGLGNYTLMVRAQNSAGVWGEYAQVVVTIQGTEAPPQSSPVAPPRVVPSATSVTRPGASTLSPQPSVTTQRAPTITLQPPTRTFTPVPRRTDTPVPTRTLTPPPPVGCSGTPVILSFGASPSTINAGGSSTLSWGTVSNADSVEIDNGIGGVPAPGSTTVSPSATTVYVLTARCKSATAIARTIVNVIQPPTPTLILRQVPSRTPTRTPIIPR